MKVLLIGLGSIGRRHLNILYNHTSHDLFALRSGPVHCHIEMTHTNLSTWDDVDAVRPDVAFVCNPTYLHIQTALECARRGMHLFIEKPLDCREDGLEELLRQVEQKDLTAYVAYPLRFNGMLQAMADGIENSEGRIMCMTDGSRWVKREMAEGGGAILELSHEIDLAQYLFGEITDMRVAAYYILNEYTDAETDVYVACDHIRGNRSFIHLNIMAGCERRYVKIDSEKLHYRATDRMYHDQIDYFFNNIGNPELMNNIFYAARLFKKIMEARQHAFSNDLCSEGQQKAAG